MVVIRNLSIDMKVVAIQYVETFYKVILFLLISAMILLSSVAFATGVDKQAVNFFRIKKNTQIENIKFELLSTEDETFKLLSEQLTHFDFQHKATNYGHILEYMKIHPNTCIRNLVKSPEREQYLIFSRPQTLFLAARLYFSPKYLNDKLAPNSIHSLQKVFQAYPDLIIGIEKARSYGAELDMAIRNIPDKNKYFVDGSDNEALMVMMLNKGRIQTLLEYPTVFKLDSQSLFPSQSFASVALSDVKPFVFGRIACSKTETGQEVINQINHVLPGLYSHPAYLQAHLKWLDEGSHFSFRQLFQQHLVQAVK